MSPSGISAEGTRGPSARAKDVALIGRSTWHACAPAPAIAADQVQRAEPPRHRRPRPRGRQGAARTDRAPRAAGGDQARRDDDARSACSRSCSRATSPRATATTHLASLDEQLKLRDFDRLGIRAPEGLQRGRRDRLLRRALDRRRGPPRRARHPLRARRQRRALGQGDALRRRQGQPLARGLRAAAPGGRRRPDGVVEVYLPYAPVAAAIAEDSRRLYLLLALGFAAPLRDAVPDRRRRLAPPAPPGPARRPHRPAQPRAALRPDGGRADRGASAAASPPRCCSSTSTASRRSTTRSGTTRGDRLLEEVAARLQRRGAPRRHARPARRRRVRRAAARAARPRDGRRARRPPAGRDRAPVRCSTASSAVLDASIGDRPLPRARDRRAHAGPARRRRDVRRQALAHQHRDLLAGPRSRTRPSGCSCSASCAPRSAPASSSCTTSRRSTSPRSA